MSTARLPQPRFARTMRRDIHTAKPAAVEPMLIVRKAAVHPMRLSTPPNQSRLSSTAAGPEESRRKSGEGIN